MEIEEINKKAFEAFPKLNRCDFADDDAFGSAILVQTIKRDAYTKALEEISALPTIKGWVARDGQGGLVYSTKKMVRVMDGHWRMWKHSMGVFASDLFPALRWEDEPIEVELPIIVKKED